ncbi:MAG: T9SS type A sorting domain-containing protein [Fimbriimonadaceae bacterium]|nr:T9SS type A sorting domain-containing protein [Chitinophagales bacterium]
MKKLFLSILLILPFLSIAQNYCGTLQTEEQLTWLRDFQANYTGSDFRGGDTYYVPLKVHIVGTDEGTGYMNAQTVMQDICDLNDKFAATGFHFYLFEGINYINNDDYYNHDWDDGYLMMVNNNVANVSNMYFVNDPVGNCGYFSYGGDATAINNDCGGIGNSTIAHELGHFFSLPHTFYGWEWGEPAASDQEEVDGDNCNSAADGFCDTPPDYAPFRWNCSSPPDYTDPDGVEFTPDGTYYMSYSNDACTDKFSEEQMDAMRGNLNGPRNNLSDHPAVTFTDVDSTALIAPEDGAVHQYPNYTVLKWKAVENAEGYVLQIAYTPTFSAVKYDIFTTDTFFLATDLAAEFNYKWRVKVLGEANTCEPAGNYRTFETGAEYLSAIDENNLVFDQFIVYPNPTNNTEMLHVDISSAVTKDVLLQITDMTGKVMYAENYKIATSKQTLNIPVQKFAEGIYLMHVSDATNIQVQKIIITK